MLSSHERGHCPSTVTEALRFFAQMGFDTVPLIGRSKRPQTLAWPTRPPPDMWSEVNTDANIGIRGGGAARLAVLDFDDKARAGTLSRGLDWLAGLGLHPGDYPLVRTASGIGRHAYVSLMGSLPGHSARLSPDLGAGELRYGPAAYVVAPPSVVAASRYELLSGSFDDVPQIPVSEILTVIVRTGSTRLGRPTQTGLDLKRVSVRTWNLMDGLGTAQYGSRSEAEEAIIVGLIRAGATYDDVERIFQEWPCAGRYREEHARSANRACSWLRRSYDNAVAFLERLPSAHAEVADEAIAWAMTRPWPGRTGQSDQAVLVAHATIAKRAGRLDYGASMRELAVETGLTPETCQKATKRLRQLGLITLMKTSSDGYSNIYRLLSQSWTISHRGEE
jgi:hypothetical protein